MSFSDEIKFSRIFSQAIMKRYLKYVRYKLTCSLTRHSCRYSHHFVSWLHFGTHPPGWGTCDVVSSGDNMKGPVISQRIVRINLLEFSSGRKVELRSSYRAMFRRPTHDSHSGMPILRRFRDENSVPDGEVGPRNVGRNFAWLNTTP
jgi:hypothetical protein